MPRSELVRTSAELIVTSRLLVLQSKRMILDACERRLVSGDPGALQVRARRLRAEVDHAHEMYGKSVLRWASPGSVQYWPIAYASLIDGAETLAERLRRTEADLPAADRLAVRSDIACLDGIVERWRKSVLMSANGAVA